MMCCGNVKDHSMWDPSRGCAQVLTGSVKFVGQPYYFHHRDYLSGLALDHQECDSSKDPSARLAV